MPMPAAAAAALRRSSCRVAHLQASTLPLVRGVAACGHKFPTILVSKFCVLCTPNLHSPFPNFCIGWKITKFAYQFRCDVATGISSEDLCIWPAQNCRVLLLDTRLAAAESQSSRQLFSRSARKS
jgi:hypothetical protein